MYKLFSLFTGLVLCASLSAQPNSGDIPAVSNCHIFVDEQNIWTLEMIEETPVLNFITLSQGRWDFAPAQVHIYDQNDNQARVERFSMDRGDGESIIRIFLRVLGKSFMGVDLVGEFEGFGEPKRVLIDLGRDRFVLQPISCGNFDALAQKIDRINVNSPDIFQDFQILQITPMGDRDRRPEAP